MWVLWLILIGLAAVIAVVIYNTSRFVPLPDTKSTPAPIAPVDQEMAAQKLAAMIRCKTVSSRDKSQEDPAEFEKFKTVLSELFPLVHQRATVKELEPRGLLYHVPGESKDHPVVFMSHFDVVAATQDAWQKPAFDGVIEDGVLWGRGTLDTKVTLLGVMQSAETLFEQGFTPKNDLYFSFAGDEEIAGESAPAIVDELERMGVVPALVLDEGGAVVEGVFPGVDEPCALVGIAEKGMLDLEFFAQGAGGHASAPPPHTLVGELAQACVHVENRPFPARLTRASSEMFDTLGRRSTYVYRMIFANLWLFKPVLDMICRKRGGEMNALMRTTVAFTCMQGSKGTNVLPPEASMTANLRLISGETVDSAVKRIRHIIKNDKIQLRVIHGMNPSPESSTESDGWIKLKRAIEDTWPDAVVSPYLMVACSDSRHFCRISGNVLRFSAMALTKEERGMIHGNDERIPVEKIARVVEFYIRLMSQC
jgi:carboxypeptidase PM20D1